MCWTLHKTTASYSAENLPHFISHNELSSSWDARPFGHNRHGPKIGGCAPLWGAGSPSNTVWPEPRPTSIPSGILVHPAISPQQIWAENWGCAPLGRGKLGPHLTQCGQSRGLPACSVLSWSIQPFDHSQRPKVTFQNIGPQNLW